MSHHRQKGTPEEELKKSLVKMVGTEQCRDFQIIDEIIHIEMCSWE
jgi:hypothetical protein